jgi:transposase InsO family protein
MSREAHVRFWEGVGVKLPRATHLILFGERRLLRALDDFVAHYHRERNHQGLGNELITPAAAVAGGTQVRCRDRLGGLLRYYHRAA